MRQDFGPDSGLDLLITFHPDAGWSLIGAIRMERELSELVGRPVDLVSRRAIERSRKRIRRHAILDSAKTLYAA